MLIPQNSDDVMMIIETGVNNANWSSKRSCRETIRKRKMAVNFRQICFRITQKNVFKRHFPFFLTHSLTYIFVTLYISRPQKKVFILVAWTFWFFLWKESDWPFTSAAYSYKSKNCFKNCYLPPFLILIFSPPTLK